MSLKIKLIHSNIKLNLKIFTKFYSPPPLGSVTDYPGPGDEVLGKITQLSGDIGHSIVFVSTIYLEEEGDILGVRMNRTHKQFGYKLSTNDNRHPAQEPFESGQIHAPLTSKRFKRYNY